MKHKITLIRRIVQWAAFLFLFYGALLWPKPVEIGMLPAPKPDKSQPKTSKYADNRILWVSSKAAIFDFSLPTLTCRFMSIGPLFLSCSLHWFSENITWLTSLRIVLPHLLLFFVLAFVLARFWCGWVCPLGAMQDVLNWIRKALRLNPLIVSDGWNGFFAKTRQFLLYMSLVVSALIAIPAFGFEGANDALFLIYCQLCPARLIYPLFGGVKPCYYDFTNSITIFMTVLGWLFLAFFLVSLAVPRLWCRICAIGALVSYFNRGGLARLEKNSQKCTFCGACRRCCPVDISLVYQARDQRVVTDPKCVLCLRCVQECPEKDCLEAKLAGQTIAKS